MGNVRFMLGSPCGWRNVRELSRTSRAPKAKVLKRRRGLLPGFRDNERERLPGGKRIGVDSRKREGDNHRPMQEREQTFPKRDEVIP